MSVWVTVCRPRRLGVAQCSSPLYDRCRFASALNRTCAVAPEPGLMTVAYVLVQTEPGREKEVHDALLGVPVVAELMPLFGEYDLIAKVSGADPEAIQGLILGSFRTIPGVLSTKTLVGAK